MKKKLKELQEKNLQQAREMIRLEGENRRQARLLDVIREGHLVERDSLEVQLRRVNLRLRAFPA